MKEQKRKIQLNWEATYNNQTKVERLQKYHINSKFVTQQRKDININLLSNYYIAPQTSIELIQEIDNLPVSLFPYIQVIPKFYTIDGNSLDPTYSSFNFLYRWQKLSETEPLANYQIYLQIYSYVMVELQYIPLYFDLDLYLPPHLQNYAIPNHKK